MEKQLDCRIPRSFFFIVMLFLSIKGRINFLQLERFSGFCEQRFRYFFEQSFDFFAFNKILIMMNIKGKVALAFDPSHLSKAGKKTLGVGYFCLIFTCFFRFRRTASLGLERMCRESKVGIGVLWISGFGFDKEDCFSFVWFSNY